MLKRRLGFNRLLSSRAHGRANMRENCSRAGICGEEGATLVEFALASVILVMILFGTIEVAIAGYSFDFVSEAARDATRYAIVRGSASCNASYNPQMPDCSATNAQIQAHVRRLNYPAINTSNLTTTTVWYSATGGPPNMTWTSCGATKCNAIGNAVKVTVYYTFPLTIPFWGQNTIHMSNSSQMVISQ